MRLAINTEYHIIELTRDPPPEVMDWVRKNFGNGDDGRWSFLLNKFYFRNSSDHLMFTLKWS